MLLESLLLWAIEVQGRSKASSICWVHCPGFRWPHNSHCQIFRSHPPVATPTSGTKAWDSRTRAMLRLTSKTVTEALTGGAAAAFLSRLGPGIGAASNGLSLRPLGGGGDAAARQGRPDADLRPRARGDVGARALARAGRELPAGRARRRTDLYTLTMRRAGTASESSTTTPLSPFWTVYARRPSRTYVAKPPPG